MSTSDIVTSSVSELKDLLSDGQVISVEVAKSFLRNEKKIIEEDKKNSEVLGTKMNKQVDVNKKLKSNSSLVPISIVLIDSTPLTTESEENKLLFPNSSPIKSFSPGKEDISFQRVVSHVSSIYDYDESCFDEISKCPGGSSNWYKRRYGNSDDDKAAYYNDSVLQQIMPIVWRLTTEEEQRKQIQKFEDSLDSIKNVKKRPLTEGFDYYNDIVDVQRKVEKPVFVKIQENPLLCPFYYSMYIDPDQQGPLKDLFQKKKSILLSILDVISSKMVSSFETLIRYILENDIDLTRKEEILTSAKEVLTNIFVFLGFANYADFKNSLGVKEDVDKSLGTFLLDQVVEDSSSLLNLLKSFNENTLKTLIGVLKRIVSSEFSLQNLEKVSYVYRGFRKLLQVAVKKETTTLSPPTPLTAELFEPFFKKKGNLFLSLYEDVSSSLRVYIRINTGPPPGVTSPFYENVRNVTSLKPYSKKRSCQSIEDCSVAPAIKASSGKSIVYRKTEGYDGVFHRMLASDKNPINTQDIFKECYSSTVLLKDIAVKIAVSESDKINVTEVDKFKKQLQEFLNKDIFVSGNGVVYDVSSKEKQNSKVEDQIFVTLCNSMANQGSRVSCQITKIELSSSGSITVTLLPEYGAVLDSTKHTFLVLGNLKSLIIDNPDTFASSNEGMTVASFGEFQEVYESVNRHLDRGYDANKEIYYGNCSYLVSYDSKISNVLKSSDEGRLFMKLFDESQSFFLNKAILIDEHQNAASQQPELNRLRLVPLNTSSTPLTLTFRDMMTLSKRKSYGKFPFQLVKSDNSLLEPTSSTQVELKEGNQEFQYLSLTGTSTTIKVTISISDPFPSTTSSLPDIIKHEYYTYTFEFTPSEFTDIKLDFFSLGSLFYESEIMEDSNLVKEEDKGLFRLLQGQFVLRDQAASSSGTKFAFAVDTYDFEADERRNYFDELVALKKTNEGLCDLVNLVKENCSGFTIFGYGYSGTGKSYTLFGDASKNLFERVRSCFELYVKNMKALGITSPQFMSLQMVINKIKAKIVSTEGIPIYNVPRGDTTRVYGYTWTNGSWKQCQYREEEVPFRYGLPHPMVIKNIRLLQERPKEPKTLTELKNLATSEKVIFLVKDSKYLIDSSRFLCIEDTDSDTSAKTTYAVPYYDNFNLDDILLCEDRNKEGNLYKCENGEWVENVTVAKPLSASASIESVFQGSLVLKKSSKVIPVDDGLRFFIDDCITDDDVLDTWAEADSKKVMLIVSYLQWYILEDLYNTIELVGSRESYSLKKGVFDQVVVDTLSEQEKLKFSEVFQKELISSDEKHFEEAVSRRNKISCLYTPLSPTQNELFTKHGFRKEKNIYTPFQVRLQQKIDFLEKRKTSIKAEVGNLMERFKELNRYVPNKGMNLGAGYGKSVDGTSAPIAEDKLRDDITYYDLILENSSIDNFKLNLANINIMHYLVYKYEIYSEFGISKGIRPVYSGTKPKELNLSHSYLITQEVKEPSISQVFQKIETSLTSSDIDTLNINYYDDNGTSKTLQIKKDIFSRGQKDVNLYFLLNYFFSSSANPDKFLSSTFTFIFNLSEEDKNIFVRLSDIQEVLQQLFTLRAEYKSVSEELQTFLQPLSLKVKEIVNRSTSSSSIKYEKQYSCELSFYEGSSPSTTFRISSDVKKQDYLDIILKLKDENKRNDVKGGYALETPDEYVEQSISYFHLFHIPSTKMVTGKTGGKGPVYGFVQLTMKNLIKSGYIVKMYAAFDLYGTMKNPKSNELDTSQMSEFLTNGKIKRYNFLRDMKRYEDDLLFSGLDDQPETNLTNEMSEDLVKICADGFKNEEDIASFYELLQKIEKKRIEVGCIKPTPNNPQSSRGHLFLIFEVTRNPSSPPMSEDDKWFSPVGEVPKKTYITVIDMAGVENPLTIAQKVNTFEKGMDLSDQKEKMFTWYTGADGGYQLLSSTMSKFEGEQNVASKVTHSIVQYAKREISTPLRKEKEDELKSLKNLMERRVSTTQTDIKKLVENMKSTEKSTFYSEENKYPFLAGFKICDTCETFYNLVVKVLELVNFQNILDELMKEQPSHGFESNYRLQTFSLKSNQNDVTNFSDLGISVKNLSEVILTVSYTLNAVNDLEISDTIKQFLSSEVSIMKISGKTFSYSLPKIVNKNNSYDFSTDFFNDSFTKLQGSFPRQANFSKENLLSYVSKYCSEEMIKNIKKESEQAQVETKYEKYLQSKRGVSSVQIDQRNFDSMYLDRYTLRSFFENYQKQENETGLFVDANFLFFRLKGFPLKKWLEKYLEDNDQNIKDRFKELLTSSGFGLECQTGQPCERLASYLLVETLMDEDVFKEMLTLSTDFVKIGDKDNGIHNQEFLRRKAKDDYEKIDNEIEKLTESTDASSIDQRNKLIMKKQVLQYLYYYTPWWGGSVLFKTDDCGMGFSVDKVRLGGNNSFIEKIFELQKHCLIALIEQIINEGYFINETISHIVTYFKHTSRGVSESDPLRLHEMKGKVQPVPLTLANANPKSKKSETYFVKGSTQINPKFLLSDLEKEYVPLLNPLKAKHLKKLFDSLSTTIKSKGRQQLLFTVYKTALEINEIEIRQKQSKEKQNQTKSLSTASSEPISKVSIDLLDGYQLKLSVTSSSLENVDKEFRKELNLETVSLGSMLLETVDVTQKKYKLSPNLSTMLQRYITDASVLQEVIKKVKCDSSGDGSALQQKCIECSKIYTGPNENRDAFCNTLKKYLETGPELDYTKDVVVDKLVDSLVTTSSGDVKEDTTFEPFSNYYRDFKKDSIDNFDSAMQSQLSNNTNTVKMIPLLQYLKNLTGGKCKYVMLCLIRPEIKAQYCEGARKGLQFAQAVASTSSKDEVVQVVDNSQLHQSGQGKKSKRRSIVWSSVQTKKKQKK